MICDPERYLDSTSDEEPLLEDGSICPTTAQPFPMHILDDLVYLLSRMTGLFLHSLNGAKILFARAMRKMRDRIDTLWHNFFVEFSHGVENVGWEYQNAWTALVTAYFATTDFFWFYFDINGYGTTGVVATDIEDSCEVILRCCACIEGQEMGCAFLRVFFPLATVSLHSPSLKQRNNAYITLNRWLEHTAFIGMSSVVLGRVRAGDNGICL